MNARIEAVVHLYPKHRRTRVALRMALRVFLRTYRNVRVHDGLELCFALHSPVRVC
jgi:hypothetical protein